MTTIHFVLLTTVLVTTNADCRDNFGSNCLSNATICHPYAVSMSTRCEFVKCCCSNQLEDPMFDYLQFQFCHNWGQRISPYVEIANAIVLVIIAINIFLMLGNLANNFFSLIMTDISEAFGVSHNIAGVTFLAFGNGAPDIFSSLTAIGLGGEQLKLAFGGLLGGAVFIPILVTAVIATYASKKPPKVSKKPFIRDCIFLLFAALYIFILTMYGTVNIWTASAMIILYFIYVTIAILNEVYIKLKKETLTSSSSTATRSRKYTLTDKIVMKVAVLFHMPISNDTENETLNEISTAANVAAYASNTSLASGQYQSIGFNQMATTKSLLQLRESQANYNRSNEEDDDEFDIETMSDILSMVLTEKRIETNKCTHWSIKLLLFLFRLPTFIVDCLCKITIPLTNEKYWNDMLSILSCITAPLWVLFSFGIFEYWYIAIALSFPCIIASSYYARKKYISDENDTNIDTEHSININTALTKDEDRIDSMVSIMELTNTKTKYKPKRTSTITHSKISNRKYTHISIPMNSQTPNSQNVSGTNIDLYGEITEIEPSKQAVMKYFFLFVGFVSAIAWINLLATELINILTTLGIASNIDLGFLGLTVLAWGNCIGDLVADVGVCKKGYPKMAIAAAISGPTLNILIGAGLGTTIACVKKGSIDLPMSDNIFFGCLGVIIGILLYIIVVASSSWRLNKSFGYFLYGYYVLFLIVNILGYRYTVTGF
eukprot:248494_1